MTKLTIKILLILITTLLIGCRGEGELYKKELLNTIKLAEKIVITEHSDQIDFFDEKLEEQKKYTEKVYKTIVLSKLQKEAFVKYIEAVDNKTQDEFPACAAEIHHTIKFYKLGSQYSTLGVCFECGQIEWDIAKHAPPWGIYNGLEEFVKSVGLHPKRDWEKLAKQSK